jgi:hypothetical protein
MLATVLRLKNTNGVLKWLTHTRHFFSAVSFVGLLVLRLFAGFRVLGGLADNMVWAEQILDCAHYLKLYGFCFFQCCHQCAWQASGATLLLLGWQHCMGCLLLIVNFSVVVWKYRRDRAEQATPAAAMLFSAVTLLLTGLGRWAWSDLQLLPTGANS